MQDNDRPLILDPDLIAQMRAIATGALRDPAQAQPIMRQLRAWFGAAIDLINAAEHAVMLGEYTAAEDLPA